MNTSVGQLVSGFRSDPLPGDALEVLNGPEDGRLFTLGAEVSTIGRSDSAEVGLLLDQAVSRVHARLVRQDGVYHLEDLGSAHGTLVNGSAIQGAATLAGGDEIQVGTTLLVLRLKDGPSERRAGTWRT